MSALLATAASHAEQVVRETLDRFPGRVALACSFGGPSGMVLLDLVQRVDRDVPVYYIDTGLLFPQTYALVERVAHRYGIAPVALAPELSLVAQAERFGDALWARDPDRCCALRKVAPHRTYLTGFDAWFTGLRHAQSTARRAVERVAQDGAQLVKVSPLLDWSDDDVWSYVNLHDVPVNALHAGGYPSIGCVPCTRAVAPGEDPRAGRWAGFDKSECGLHLQPEARS